jgi:hypothetical protein
MATFCQGSSKLSLDSCLKAKLIDLSQLSPNLASMTKCVGHAEAGDLITA